MSFYEFEGNRPIIGEATFVHPQAIIIGNVTLGKQCYVGAGAVIRGDYGKIVIGNGTNVQENVVIHAEPDSIAIIEDNVLIGHGAIVHGPCLIKTHSTIGMGAILNIRCLMEEETLLAAGSLLPPGKTIPARKIAMGNPARIVKDIDERILNYNKIAVKLYQDLALRCSAGLKLIK